MLAHKDVLGHELAEGVVLGVDVQAEGDGRSVSLGGGGSNGGEVSGRSTEQVDHQGIPAVFHLEDVFCRVTGRHEDGLAATSGVFLGVDDALYDNLDGSIRFLFDTGVKEEGHDAVEAELAVAIGSDFDEGRLGGSTEEELLLVLLVAVEKAHVEFHLHRALRTYVLLHGQLHALQTCNGQHVSRARVARPTASDGGVQIILGLLSHRFFEVLLSSLRSF